MKKLLLISMLITSIFSFTAGASDNIYEETIDDFHNLSEKNQDRVSNAHSDLVNCMDAVYETFIEDLDYGDNFSINFFQNRLNDLVIMISTSICAPVWTKFGVTMISTGILDPRKHVAMIPVLVE